MLNLLKVENFGLIHKAEVQFDRGFTAVTGESGAGKSLLLTAIPAVFGLSATADQIGPFAPGFRIRAVFSLSSSDPLWDELHQWGIDEDDILIIQREMSHEGRSVYRVQGQIVTRQAVRELAPKLIDFSGQHHALRLFESGQLLLWLDRYATLNSLREATDKAYYVWRSVKASHADLIANVPNPETLAARRQDLDELTALQLDADEEERLGRDLARLHSRQRLLELLQTIEEDLENDESGNVLSLLNRISHNVAHLVRLDPTAAQIATLVEQAIAIAEETRSELNEWASHLDQDPGQLETLETRANELARVKRRYNMSIEELLRHVESLQEDLARWEDFEWQLHLAERKLQEAEREYFRLAKELSQARKVAAQKVSEELSRLVHEMEMPASTVQFSLEPADPAAWGVDHGIILYASSVQQELRPATKVASGGELSRIALAMAVLGGTQGGATLIFDELDQGLGGQSAARVGRLLRSLGERQQVIAISHQPSVAASAHYQWTVVKMPDDTGAHSKVKFVDGHDREEEIARMLSGQSDNMAMDHARHLLNREKRGD